MQRQLISRAEPKGKAANPLWAGDEAARPLPPLEASGRSQRGMATGQRPASAMSLSKADGRAAENGGVKEQLDGTRSMDTQRDVIRLQHQPGAGPKTRPHSGWHLKSA